MDETPAEAIVNVCLITRPDLLPASHGAAVKIMRTAEALVALGARVFIVTNDRVWFFKSEGGQLVRARYPQALLSLTNVPGGLKGRLEALGFPNYWRGLQRALDAIGYPRDEHFLYQPIIDADFLARVLYVGWAHQIDVYQAEFPGYAAPAIVAKRLLGGTTVMAEHNVEYERLAATTGLSGRVIARLKDIELGLAARVDHIVTCSEEDREILTAAGGEASRMAVIPHGVELAPYDRILEGDELVQVRARVRERYRLPVEGPLLVFHGTLHYWPNTVAVKRIAEELLPRLEARGLNARVMICGMNPPSYYAHPRIHFTQMVQDLPEHLLAADLAVVPLEDGGGTRLKILEYFAAGLPVVSTQKGAEGIPVRDGVELALRDDYDAFADAVVDLLGDARRARHMGEAGRRFAQAYSWEEVGRRWMDLYAGKVPAPFPIPPIVPLPPAARVVPAAAKATSPSKNGALRLKPSELPVDPLAAAAAQIPLKVNPTKPPTMIMMINRGCNLRCAFCDLYERPKLFAEGDALPIIDDAARMGVKTVVFTGGEPMLHPALFRMIAHAKGLGLGTNVTTNGTYIEKHLKKILDSGLDSISVSLDGLAQTHEAIRGVEGCYDKTLTGLRLLKEAGGPHVNIYFVVTGQNVDELIPVYELALELGFGFDFWPVNDAHDAYIITPEARDAYRAAIGTLARRDAAVAAKHDYYLAGLDYHAGWDKRVRCLGLVEQFGVNLSGELVPCCVWDNTDLTIGPLAGDGAKSLSELWYSPEARLRRQQIHDVGCHNRCFNHSLYEYQLATGESFVVGEGEAPAHLRPGAKPAPPPPRADPPPHLPGSYMVVELANGCNLKCVHCAQSDPDHPHYQETGYFPPEGMRALIDDLKLKGARFDTLILFWLGEPLLHPRFAEIYGDLLSRVEPDGKGGFYPFNKIEVHTNATLLHEKVTRAVLNDAKVPQRWHFTIDAADAQTYKAVKGADFLPRVQKNVEAFYRLKAETGARWPHTALQYIVGENNAGEVADFVGHWTAVLDRSGLPHGLVARHVPDDWGRQFIFLRSLDCSTAEEQTRQNEVFRRVVAGFGLDETPSKPDPEGEAVVARNLNPCSGFWKSPVIGWDGTLTTCTRDNFGMNAVGNVLKTPFTQLWWGDERLNAWRAGVAKGDYGDRVLCKGCFIPQSVNYTDIGEGEIAEHQAWARRQAAEPDAVLKGEGAKGAPARAVAPGPTP